jgi:hypothetical protein
MGLTRKSFLREYVALEQAEEAMSKVLAEMLYTATLYERAGRGALALSIREHAAELKGEAKL